MVLSLSLSIKIDLNNHITGSNQSGDLGKGLSMLETRWKSSFHLVKHEIRIFNLRVLK